MTTTTATLEHAAPALPTDEHFARNLIGGQWRFPAAPYEFEIRNPADSTICAVVPLSSRFDVAAAHRAACSASAGAWARPGVRLPLVRALLARLTAAADALAELQSLETGLSRGQSRAVVTASLDLAWALLADSALVRQGPCSAPVRAPRVSGHILSWGAPFTEVVTSALPALLRGDAVIVKPSLRGPLSAVAFALAATDAGLPPGVVNVVQGTGGDIGADLIGRRDLSALHVRAGERTIAHATRSRTGVALHTVRGGGNVAIVGPGLDVDGGAVALLADTVAAAVRRHSAGGPFGLPLLAVHAEHVERVATAVGDRLDADPATAPLPTEPLRRRAVERIEALQRAGAVVALGGPGVPDDAEHRMSWRLPPTILLLGPGTSDAARCEQATVPLGPTLSVMTWTDPAGLPALFTAPRAADGVATVWGVDGDVRLPHGRVLPGGPGAGCSPAVCAPSWTAAR